MTKHFPISPLEGSGLVPCSVCISYPCPPFFFFSFHSLSLFGIKSAGNLVNAHELTSTKIFLSEIDSERRGLDRSCLESVIAPGTSQSLEPGPLGGTASPTKASGFSAMMPAGTFRSVEGQLRNSQVPSVLPPPPQPLCIPLIRMNSIPR